jgi:hypothetical protein
MIKVQFDPSLLDYQRIMAKLVHTLRSEKTDSRAKPSVPIAISLENNRWLMYKIYGSVALLRNRYNREIEQSHSS